MTTKKLLQTHKTTTNICKRQRTDTKQAQTDAQQPCHSVSLAVWVSCSYVGGVGAILHVCA